MADFREIVDSIFVNKQNYQNISDVDKIASFYIINKKFSLGFPNTATYFNDKSVDRATVIDLWFEKFKGINDIPGWYWKKSPFKKDKTKKISGPDIKKIKEEYELSDSDFEFIHKYYPDELDFELKMTKRWK